MYGTKDVGRRRWLRLKETCHASGFSGYQILPTLFTSRNDKSEIIAVMSSNVDDLLHGNFSECAEAMNLILRRFLGGKEACGTLQILRQGIPPRGKLPNSLFGEEDHTERVQPVDHDAKQGLTRKAKGPEVHQLRSVALSLAWIVRQTRPDRSYRFTKVQSTFGNALVRKLRHCNHILE